MPVLTRIVFQAIGLATKFSLRRHDVAARTCGEFRMIIRLAVVAPAKQQGRAVGKIQGPHDVSISKGWYMRMIRGQEANSQIVFEKSVDSIVVTRAACHQQWQSAGRQ